MVQDYEERNGNRRMDWDRHRAQVRAANRAKYRAVTQLISRYREEFDALYAEEAAREGVTPSGPLGQDEEAKLQRRLAKLRAELAEAEAREYET